MEPARAAVERQCSRACGNLKHGAATEDIAMKDPNVIEPVTFSCEGCGGVQYWFGRGTSPAHGFCVGCHYLSEICTDRVEMMLLYRSFARSRAKDQAAQLRERLDAEEYARLEAQSALQVPEAKGRQEEAERAARSRWRRLWDALRRCGVPREIAVTLHADKSRSPS
jgi:hypothetical protein